jgi:fructokinase
MSEVVALGEVLIDFTPLGTSETDNPIFERNPGGAPTNVLSMLSRLGIDTALIGKAGDDMFGHALKGILDRVGINTDGLILSERYNTTLAFVELDGNGDRTFGFVRKNGADKMLEPDEVKLSLLDGAKLFHFGGVSLTDEPSRTATLTAAREAKRRGLLISYDPNFRAPLWSGHDSADVLLEGVKLADILKVSDEECRLLSGKDDLKEGTEYLSRTYGSRLVFVTLGPKGSAFRLGGYYREQQTFDVKTIDTTGAGDAFLGGILYCILKSEKKFSEITVEDVDRYMRFANAAGSLVTTKKGAILSMPTLSQINELLSR